MHDSHQERTAPRCLHAPVGEEMTDKKKNVHVTPRKDGRWNVERSSASRASSVHDTQADAAREGKRLARQDGR